MDRPTKQYKKKSDDSFLSRWSARKTQIARGELVADEKPALSVKEVNEGELDTGEEAKLSDQELLEKFELPDPEDLADESDLTQFLDGDLPERLRQMALRRLWRLNPLFGHVCDMVEYGEDYTDAATVMEGMQTAYQVGQGYKKKAQDADEAAESETPDTEAAESEIPDAEAAESETPDTEAAESETVNSEAAESETLNSEAAESETLNSEVETEQLDDKTLDEYDDGAVFKDNAIGISGVGVQEYILPVNDISVPQVIETESKKNNTEPNRQSAKTVGVSDDVKPFQDFSEESKNDEVITKPEREEQNTKKMARPSRMVFVRNKIGS